MMHHLPQFTDHQVVGMVLFAYVVGGFVTLIYALYEYRRGCGRSPWAGNPLYLSALVCLYCILAWPSVIVMAWKEKR